MTSILSPAPSTAAALATDGSTRPVAVAIDGSDQDRPALTWAAEEANQLGRPLLITHAVGHLPVSLGYAERHTARRERQARGRRVVDAAAEWVARQVPGLTIETAVRLLEPAALLPAVADHAAVTTRSATGWGRQDDDSGRRQVLVALGDPQVEADLLAYAADYAGRRGVELVVFEDGDDRDYRRLVSRGGRGALALVSGHHESVRDPIAAAGNGSRQGWRSVLTMLSRTETPMAVISRAGRSSCPPPAVGPIS